MLFLILMTTLHFSRREGNRTQEALVIAFRASVGKCWSWDHTQAFRAPKPTCISLARLLLEAVPVY